RVIGTKNIFVADASAMRDGTVNPYGFVMYVGREAASQVKDYVGSTVTPPPATCTIENGVDYVGNDIGNALSSSAEGCCSICNNYSGCKAYSWTNQSGGTCWLKSGKGATKPDVNVRSSELNGGSVTPPPTTPTPSPVTPPPSTCSIENDVDYTGNDVGNALSSTAEGCCAMCKAFNGCNAFTWSSYSGGTCWFKSAKGATKTTAGVRSSVVNSVVTPPPSSSCSTIDENTDYTGPDIGNAPSATAEGCCAICSAKSGCGAYAWSNANGGTCWLKSHRGAKKTVTGVRSSVLNSAPKCNLENDVDYAGNDLASTPSTAAGACCDLCRARSGCKAFTWSSYNGGTCWLKTLAAAGVSKAGVVSGVI
ncbi:Carbohydrate-binding protein, partial [Globisporangium polare]